MAGWFHIASLVLIGAGIGKIRDPAPTSGALEAMRLPAGSWIVSTLGVIEVAAGSAGIVIGGAVGGSLVALHYAAFTGFVVAAVLLDRPVQSCGCFGRADTPPGRLHAAYNAGAALSGVVVAATGGGSLADTLGGQPALGIPYAAFLVIGAFASYLILAELPRLLALARTA